MIKSIGKVAGFISALCTIITFFEQSKEDKDGVD